MFTLIKIQKTFVNLIIHKLLALEICNFSRIKKTRRIKLYLRGLWKTSQISRGSSAPPSDKKFGYSDNKLLHRKSHFISGIPVKNYIFQWSNFVNFEDFWITRYFLSKSSYKSKILHSKNRWHAYANKNLSKIRFINNKNINKCQVAK